MPIASRIATTLGFGLLLATAPVAFAEAPKTDCSTTPGADAPVTLSIDGNPQPLPVAEFAKQQEMSMDEESFEVFRVNLRDVAGLFSPVEIEASVLVKKGETVDGKTFRQLPTDDMKKQPSPLKQEGAALPEVQSLEVRSDPAGFDYQHGILASMRLEFGKRDGEKLPGRIHLCIAGGQTDDVFQPQPTQTVIVEGTFVAKLQ
jgi:hypothetical protein